MIKKSFLLMSFCCLISLITATKLTFAQIPGEFEIDGNTAALWHFNEGAGSTTQDETGNNSGTISGPSWIPGRFGNALSYDGVDDRVVVPHNDALDPQEITVEAWIYLNDVNSHNYIIHKGFGSVSANSPGYSGYDLYVKSGGSLAARSFDVDGYRQDIATDNIIHANEWHYVAFTNDGITLKIYVDGELANVRYVNGSSSFPNLDSLTIGTYPHSPTWGPFNGIIDEIRISNIARTAWEIKLGYEMAFPDNADLYIEAEDFTELSADVLFDPTASHSQYVEFDQEADYIRTAFDIQGDSQRHLWIHLLWDWSHATLGDANSLWLSLNGGADIQIANSIIDKWQWIRAAELAPGTHTLKISADRLPVRIDKIVLKPTHGDPPKIIPFEINNPVPESVAINMLDWKLFGNLGYAATGTTSETHIKENAYSYNIMISEGFVSESGIEHLIVSKEITLLPETQYVNMWVYGDALGEEIRYIYRDATGEYFNTFVDTINWSGWKYVRFPIETESTQLLAHGSGNNDGIVDLPITFEYIDFMYTTEPEATIPVSQLYFEDPKFDIPISFDVSTNKVNNIFPNGEEPCVSVLVDNTDILSMPLTIYYTFADLRGNIIDQGQTDILVPPEDQTNTTICIGPTYTGLAEGLIQILNTEEKIIFGRYSDECQEAPAFSLLDESDSPTVDVGYPKTSQDTHNPFGIYTHRELPGLETLRLIADAGFGTSCESQFQSDQIAAMNLQLELGLDPVLHVSPGQEETLALAFQGKGLFYRIGIAEPNNNGIPPSDLVADIMQKSDIISSNDPTAKIQMYELGDSNPITYIQNLYDAGLGHVIDAHAWGCNADFGGGSGMTSAQEMIDIAQYWSAQLCKDIRSFVYPMLHARGRELVQAKRILRYVTDYYMKGIDRIIWYKMMDLYEDYGVLYENGTISPAYMAFQNLCSLMGTPIAPAELPFKITTTAEIPRLKLYTLENGLEEVDIILWNDEDIWEVDPYDSYLWGGAWLQPATRDKNRPPVVTNVVVGCSDYQYPIIIDLLTGSWEELDYEIIGNDILLKNIEVSGYPKMIKLVTGGTRPMNVVDEAWEIYSTSDGLASNWVTSIHPDGDDIWLGVFSYGGENADILSKYDKATGTWTNFQTHDQKVGNMVRSIISDASNVYVALWGRGVGIYSKLTGEWEIDTIENGLGSANVGALALDGGYLWVAIWGGGLSRYDLSSGMWTTYRHTIDNELTGGPAAAYRNANLMSCVAVSNRYVWAGSRHKGVSRYDKSTGTWANYITELPSSYVYTISVNGDDVWFGTRSGIGKYNEVDDTWQTYSTPESLVDKKISFITVDGDNIWFGTRYEGIALYNKASDTWALYEPATTEGLTDGRVMSIVGSNAYVWVPTWGKGVSRYNKTDGTWETFTKADGLADDRVWTVAIDGDDAWFGTYQGVTKAIGFANPNYNLPPAASAGTDLIILSEEQATAVIDGYASDPNGDALTYRWLEGGVELAGWQAVGINGEAPLNLAGLQYFSLGQHSLTLEVSDGQNVTADDMVLTVENSAPHPAPTGGGTYEIYSPVTLGGQVSDFDGDSVDYTWLEGGLELFSGQVQALQGGDPVTLPEHTVSDLTLGSHTITLRVNDGVITDPPPTSEIIVNITDTTNPTLAPVPNKTILWPPNHSMVDITIEANASDNSGDPVTLTVAVSSNEPEDGLGDGDMSPDWTNLVIDQINGIINLQLRAERSGSGDGRVYTITITATDGTGNASQAQVEILVPHDKKKK